MEENLDLINQKSDPELTDKERVDFLTQKQVNHYGNNIYSYSEKEFHDDIMQDEAFINGLSNEALIKILCRLEFSTSQYEIDKNQRSEAIFKRIIATGKVVEFKDTDWLYLLINANPTVIAKILLIDTPEKTELINAINGLTSKALEGLFELKDNNLAPSSNFKVFPTVTSEKTFSVIYPHFVLDRLEVHQKAILITALGKNLTQKSLDYCMKRICDTDFKVEHIHFMVSHLPKNNDNSIRLIQRLFETHYTKLKQEDLKLLCTLGIEVVIALLTHENNYVKTRVLDNLTLADFAEIAAIPDYRHDVKKLLKIGFKLFCNEITTEQTSNALFILLSAENGARNTDIFNFIYNNKTHSFTSAIKREHLVKSLSYPLDSDDNKLKSNLVNPSIFFSEIPILRLKKEDVFQIFLDAQKNHYVLPSNVLKVLTRLVLQHGNYFVKELLPFLAQKGKENPFSKEINNTLCLFILEAHKESAKRYPNQFNSLIKYLNSNPNLLINIISNQPTHEHLLSFLNDKNISSLLKPEDIIKFFLANSTLNPENQLFTTEAFMPFLSEETIMQIFIALAKNKCTLDIEAQKRLVEKLNFKRLNQLVKSSIEEDKENPQFIKIALDNIFYSQIHRQKAFFSIPAFILSVVYGILYYPTLGWLLQFVAPKTKPFYLYKALKKFFHPPEVARIKQKTFEKKIHLMPMEEDQPSSTKQDSIIIENCSSDELSFFNRETEEIKPFQSKVESLYIYLFPKQKEALKSKKESNEPTLPTHPTQPFNIQ